MVYHSDYLGSSEVHCRIGRRSPRSPRLPLWLLSSLVSLVLFFIGWSPYNLSVQYLFILSDKLYEEKLLNVTRNMSFPLTNVSKHLEEPVLQQLINSTLSNLRFDSLVTGNVKNKEHRELNRFGKSQNYFLNLRNMIHRSPLLFLQWNQIITFGISVWMFASFLVNYILNLNPSHGLYFCMVLGPACFLTAMIFLLYSTAAIVRYVGISLLSK